MIDCLYDLLCTHFFRYVLSCVFFRLFSPVDFAKIPSRTFNFIRRSVSREPSREGSPHISGYASGKTHLRYPQDSQQIRYYCKNTSNLVPIFIFLPNIRYEFLVLIYEPRKVLPKFLWVKSQNL